MIQSERWREIEQICEAALKRQPSERAAFLREACGEDEALRQEVEQLLAHEETAKAFLEAPALEGAAKMLAENQGASRVGQQLGTYTIISLLGVGGMGEVYRARDTRLGREVAIKILPRAFTADPDRRARLGREARALAALNHPNIATIHGIEESGGVQALVMELVDGATLAERIKRGVPLAELFAVARQIADALDAAHEKGIVHRDLKPANIKVRRDGTVKVLDFGLAKIVTGDTASGDLTQASTITVAATLEGLIVGTAAYMSPEQARGLPVDKRTDIWAFGCVLYEMLTGRAVFAAETISDTLASILGREPDWSALPETTPSTIRRLLQRCLEKDTKRRLHDIADARIEIDDELGSPTTSLRLGAEDQDHRFPRRTAGVSTQRKAVVALGAAALVAGSVAVWNLTRPLVVPPIQETVRFSIHLQPEEEFPNDAGLPLMLAISPDGNQVVYAARGAGPHRLYIRRRDNLEASPIGGTEGAIGPFFSPDGQWIGFASGGMLRAVPIAGGAPRTIAEAPQMNGASWGLDDTIVYTPQWSSGLFKVSARGGTPEVLTTLEKQRGETQHAAPQVPPDGKAVLFTAAGSRGFTIEVAEIATGKRRSLVEGRNPVYLRSGHIVFARGGTLFAMPFDLERKEMTGPTVLHLLDGVRTDGGNDTHFAVSPDGTLVYVPEASTNRRLLWIDRQGGSRPLDAERRPSSHPRISPDGSRVVVMTTRESGGWEIWIYDAARGTRTRLSPSGPVSRPVWTPDGKRITFQGEFSLYSVPADDSSAPELVLAREDLSALLFPLAWSRNGRILVFSGVHSATGRDIWMLPVGGTPAPFLATPRDERAAMFSPDGRWVVYASKEAGREEEVYVQPYPGPGGRMVISVGGGIEPVWSPTGREIFYRSVDATRMVAVDIRTDPSLQVGTPRLLFADRFPAFVGSYWSNYDVSPDGREFLMLEADQLETPRLNVVLNWTKGLK